MKSMERPKFANNEIYHIYNRGTDKREIFLRKEDYYQFIHDLFEFNDIKPAPHLNVIINKSGEVRLLLFGARGKREPRELLVEILAFILMPNHYHLLLRQRKENGITEFMRKLGTGYTNYFNHKYKRSGVLFQGKFKAVLVSHDPHFIYLPYYIHLNCLDLIEPNWRDGEIKNIKKAIEFLESFRWSSHLDYIGKKNFPSVTQREFLLDIFGGKTSYRNEIHKWLKTMEAAEIEKIKRNILE